MGAARGSYAGRGGGAGGGSGAVKDGCLRPEGHASREAQGTGRGKVLSMNDERIDGLGTNELKRTLRGAVGVFFSNGVKAPELKEKLVEAMRLRRVK